MQKMNSSPTTILHVLDLVHGEFRDVADNAHFLVRRGVTFLQTSKGCFRVQTITLDRSTLLLVVSTSTVDIPGFRDMADNSHFFVRHGNTFLQGCFPVQAITLDRFTLLLAVPIFSTVDNWDSQYSWISRYGRQLPLFCSTWEYISARLFSSSGNHTWSFHTVFGSD